MIEKTKMKRVVKRISALAVAVTMCFGVFAACGKKAEPTPTPAPPVLAVGYEGFSGKFSPFFAESESDMDVAEITGLNLLTTDRFGSVIYNAADDETIFDKGKAYTYKGIANVSVEYDDTGDRTVYTWKLREDVKFSDGEPLTADDVIFTYYTLLDPAYEGPVKLSSLDIVGLQDYRTQTTARVYNKYFSIFEAIYSAGEEHVWTGNDAWTQEMQAYFWENMKRIWMEDVQTIVDYVYGNYLSYAPYYISHTPDEVTASDDLKIVLSMAVWDFGSFEKETAIARADADGKPVTDEYGQYVLAEEGESGVEVKIMARDENGNFIFTGKHTGKTWDLVYTFPTLEDYYNECYAAYGGDPVKYWDTGAVDNTDVYNTAQSAFILEWGPKDWSLAGKGIPNIEGIRKLDDYTVQITTNGYSDTAIYTLGVIVAPLHYYGDESKYNYDNNRFGFDFGDISAALSKTDTPLGAGPYKFVKYDNNVIYFEANENYYKGSPKTGELQFRVIAESEIVSGVKSGVIDIARPDFSSDAVSGIKSLNTNGELTGDAITTLTVDNLGYGYIGINAGTVNVGGVPDGEASKNLRRAFATLFSVYREKSVSGYYAERASIINYPIVDSSPMAPQPADEGYKEAFSTDIDDNPLYRDTMTADEKYAQALLASVEFFKAAGYIWDAAAGKFIQAPVGAKLEYEIIVPGYGKGDHPAFGICESVKAALEKIGITLIITDPSSPDRFWEKVDACAQEMWCAAWEWETATGPDMYQIYHSSGIIGAGGSDSNYYQIQDTQLDDLLVQLRRNKMEAEREVVYKYCLDIITDWAVEIPVYQKNNCFIFSTSRIDVNTLTADITTFWDWMNDIELLEMR